MLKKLVDTNIFIDRFRNPDLYKDIFLAEGLVYLSAVVLLELRAGAHSKEAVKAVAELYEHFRQVDRLVLPTARDYERAGDTIARLQSAKGYNIKKSASITNDCLIAASARSIGATVYTGNRKDFEAIKSVMDVKIVFT
jgi:predicted nucleic acid-binding protein